jgi:tRNA(fMet)-specific endonuclease VapC
VNYFLDTNAVVAILRNRPEAVRSRLRRAVTRGASVSISSIVLFELWYGVARSSRLAENAERVRAFLTGNVNVVPFEEEDAAIAAEIRLTLEKAGTAIGPYDLLIAAQALRHGVTLVTANVREFARVHDLSWKDWAADPS